MGENIQINNEIEKSTYRHETVWNNTAGTLVFDNSTGRENISMAHRSGSSITWSNKVTSELNTNNRQSLTLGNNYNTINGDSFEQSRKNMEKRSFGDFTLITGSPNFFTNTVAKDYIENNRDIATAKTSPELNCRGIGNNSQAEYVAGKNTSNSSSGAVEGGTYSKSTTQQHIQKLYEDKVESNADIEKKMGVGGSIKLLSCKHVFIQAGTNAVNYDSGVIIPNARPVTQQYDFDKSSGNVVEKKTAIAVYENKDTTSTIPFGDIHFSSANKLNLQAGAGGISLQSSGETKIVGSGRVAIGGAEIAIGSSTGDSAAGRVTIVTDQDIFMESDVLITMHSSNVNTVADSQYTIVSPMTLATGDCHIQGDLRVQGNLFVQGTIYANDTITSAVDVIAGGISLKNHTHGGVTSGSSTTGVPQ